MSSGSYRVTTIRLPHDIDQPSAPYSLAAAISLQPPPPPTSTSSTTVTDLSDELQLLVLRFLDARTFLRARRAHRDLLAVSRSDDDSCWENSHFQPRQREAFLAALPAFDYLVSLDLTLLPALTDAELHSILLYCSRLTAIDLSQCWALSNRAFLSLSRLLGGRLRSVSFPSETTQRLDSVAVSLSCMAHTGLTSIELRGCSWLGQDNLIHLIALHSLQTLRLLQMRQLGSSCLSFLRYNAARRAKVWPSLTALSLCGCIGVDDETMASIALLPQLRRLDLSGCWRVCGAGVRMLAGPASLCWQSVEEMLLDGCSVPDLAESVLQCVQSMPALAALQLPLCYYPTNTPCERSLLAQLLSAPSLTRLGLMEWSLSEAELLQASGCARAQLQSFTLRGATLERSLSFLGNNTALASLTTLALEGVNVCEWDESQAEVRLTAMRHLSLKRSPHAHLMLPLLVRHASLLSLDISFCQSADDAAWTTLAAHSPALAVVHAQATPVSHTALLALSALRQLHTLNLFQSPVPTASLALFTDAARFPALATLCLTVDPWPGWQQWKADAAAAHADLLLRAEGEEAGGGLGGGDEEVAEDDADGEWQPSDSDSDDWREEAKDEREEERMETELRGDEERAVVAESSGASSRLAGVAEEWNRATMVASRY